MTSSNQPDGILSSRLSPAQQLKRLVLMVALIGLIATGIPQKFALESWADFVITMLGGIESARILHRFFAALLTAAVIYHVVSFAYQWFVLKRRSTGLPTRKDWAKLFSITLANLGLREQPETDNRLSLKFEYLVLVVSIVILGITGAVLLNPVLVAETLPGSAIPIAQSVHSDHALLFTVVLIVWRFGIHMLWRPQRVLVETNNVITSDGAQQMRARRRAFTLISGITVLLVGIVLLRYATYETTAIDTVARHEVLVFSPQFVPEVGNPTVGELVWSTQRCAFCHGENADGGVNGGPALPTENLTFEAFVSQVREGDNQMPAFTKVELPDSYLVHLWAWLSEPRQ